MIPKIIHYIWFGGKPYPDKIKFCIETWKKYLPEYEFKLWNEDSFNVNSIRFTKEAYEQKKWAFVSDYVRVWALYNYGGIYLDTDIEIRKPLDKFLSKQLVLGTDELGFLTAFMASEPRHILWKRLLDYYKKISFYNPDGSLNQTVNNTYIQDILKEYGYRINNEYQEIDTNIVIYPDDWFHAIDHMSGKSHITENTHAIHWHTLTWCPPKTHFNRFLRVKILKYLIGGKNATKLNLMGNKIKRRLRKK